MRIVEPYSLPLEKQDRLRDFIERSYPENEYGHLVFSHTTQPIKILKNSKNKVVWTLISFVLACVFFSSDNSLIACLMFAVALLPTIEHLSFKLNTHLFHYKPGTYLLPFHIVDASETMWKIYRLKDSTYFDLTSNYDTITATYRFDEALIKLSVLRTVDNEKAFALSKSFINSDKYINTFSEKEWFIYHSPFSASSESINRGIPFVQKNYNHRLVVTISTLCTLLVLFIISSKLSHYTNLSGDITVGEEGINTQNEMIDDVSSEKLVVEDANFPVTEDEQPEPVETTSAEELGSFSQKSAESDPPNGHEIKASPNSQYKDVMSTGGRVCTYNVMIHAGIVSSLKATERDVETLVSKLKRAATKIEELEYQTKQLEQRLDQMISDYPDAFPPRQYDIAIALQDEFRIKVDDLNSKIDSYNMQKLWYDELYLKYNGQWQEFEKVASCRDTK